MGMDQPGSGPLCGGCSTKDTLEEAVEFIVTTFDELIGTPPGRRVRERRGGDRRTDTIDVELNDLELERQAAFENYVCHVRRVRS